MAISKVVYHSSSSDTTGTTWMDVTDKTSGNSILSIGGGGSGVTLAGYFTVQAPAYKGHEYAIRVGNGRTYVYTYFYPEKVRS